MAQSNKEPKIVHRSQARKNRPSSGPRRMDNARRPTLLRFTFIVIYKNLYLLGMTLLRRQLRARRRIRRFWVRLWGGSLHFWERFGERLVQFRKGLARRIAAPFVRLGTVRGQMRPVIERSRQDGKIPLRAYGTLILTFFRLLFTILRTVFNYAVPVVAAILLINYIGGRVNQPIGLDVYYNDLRIGFIEVETDFEAAAQIIKKRYISSDTSALIATPQFVIREAKPGEAYTPQNELANRILATSQDKIVNAYGFYVDGRFYGAVRDSAPLIDELESILQEAATGSEDEDVNFAKRVQAAVPGIYPLSSIVDMKSLKAKIRSFETVDEIYTVEYGDSPSLISTKTGLSYDSIMALNPVLETVGLRPGQQLLLNQARPFMTVMNTYTSVYEEEVPYEIEEIETSTYVKGYRMISVKGQPGQQQITAAISTVNGVEIGRDILDRVLLQAPVTEKVIVGTNNPQNIVASGAQVSSSGFMWPTQGGVITVGLGGYPGHTGVDIPRPSGTPIFASAAGQVVRVINSSVGYGRYVMVDHGNGFTTLYAHASAIHVTVGQQVNQGDVIASVGRTGNSTGNHLHFEVRYNGQIMNPRNYIG